VFGESSPYLCEIMAAIEALRRVKEGIKNVYLLTDCQDLVNYMEGIDTSKLYGNQFRGGRGGSPVKERTEAKLVELRKMSKKFDIFLWTWIKGHKYKDAHSHYDNCGNEIADFLAKMGRKQAEVERWDKDVQNLQETYGTSFMGRMGN
jgi:ribonuclease HI